LGEQLLVVQGNRQSVAGQYTKPGCLIDLTVKFQSLRSKLKTALWKAGKWQSAKLAPGITVAVPGKERVRVSMRGKLALRSPQSADDDVWSDWSFYGPIFYGFNTDFSGPQTTTILYAIRNEVGSPCIGRKSFKLFLKD